jgi:hypothetical protein
MRIISMKYEDWGLVKICQDGDVLVDFKGICSVGFRMKSLDFGYMSGWMGFGAWIDGDYACLIPRGYVYYMFVIYDDIDHYTKLIRL